MILIIKDYIFLIGFVTLRDDEPMHTWTGRIIRLLMSLFESNGSVSLKSLFNNVTDLGAFLIRNLKILCLEYAEDGLVRLI